MRFRVTAVDLAGNRGSDESDAVFGTETDSDGDGLPDAWETMFQLDPNQRADATRDADGDGETNLAEYRAGTDLRVGAARLMISSVERIEGRLRIRFASLVGKTYELERADSLGKSWLTVAAQLVGTGQVLEFGPLIEGTAAFFRVVQRP